MKVLCLGAHPDDIELGAGATIYKLISEGHKVFAHVFTVNCDEYRRLSLPIEMDESFEQLGIKKANSVSYLKVSCSLKPRNLPRQEILDGLLCLRDTLQPDLVFTHSSTDTHQDHQVIHNETYRAFKDRSILGYDMPWNTRKENLNTYHIITKEQIEAKVKALSFYKSQNQRTYTQPEYIESLARLRGTGTSTRYAEAFETIRWIL